MLFKQNPRIDQTAIPHHGVAPANRLALPPATPSTTQSAPAAAPTAEPAETATDGPDDGTKRLIVGQGIQLRGEITACDRLVVEGEVEVMLNETRVLEIRPSGRFAGGCEVEEAVVSGIYEGDLVVRGRLTVREGGRVAGSISYGEIELERGAQISGELSMRETKATSAAAPSDRRDAA
jgi:cytoskeletal protein CcmA (bactofilin family)